MHSSTNELARLLTASSWHAVDEAIGDESVRSIVNWLGVALSGVREACDDLDLSFSGLGIEATALGIGERFDAVDAAAMTAAGADRLCFVDTHVPTMLSPAVVVGGALLPLAEHLGASGARFVHAYTLGVETACRAGMVLLGDARPQASLASTALGAAAACAVLAQLDQAATADVLRVAWTHASRQGGTRPSAGYAARIGLIAGTNGARQDDGSTHVASASTDLPGIDRLAEALLDPWGETWQCARIGYHAYPCALDLHAVVEACLQLKRMHHLTARQVGAVRVSLAPQIVARNRGPSPQDGVEARYSVEHAAAIALVDGEAGLAQFEPQRLRSGRIRALRETIEVAAQAGLAETAALVVVTLAGGERSERTVRCALGHPLRPLGDHDLSEKFRRLAAEVLATDQAERLLGLAWNIRALPDMGGLVRTSIPEEVVEPTELPGSPLLPR